MLSRNQLSDLWQLPHHEIGTEYAGSPTLLLSKIKAYESGIKEQIVEVAIYSSGIRDTACVLKMNKNTVIMTLKKQDSLVHVNRLFHASNSQTPLEIRLELVCDAAELNEQWLFVGKKSNQRWLRHAVDHTTNTVLAYVFGQHKDVVFKVLKVLLASFISVVITRMTGVHMSAI